VQTAKMQLKEFSLFVPNVESGTLMFQVADRAQISPLRLSFTGTLNVVQNLK
jgi:hypothetical protein